MTDEQESIITFYFSMYRQNKEQIKHLREDAIHMNLTSNYMPKNGKRVKGENKREKVLININNMITELEAWCKIYEQGKGAYFYDDIKRQFMEWKFEKDKSMTQIMNGLYICDKTYKSWMQEILTHADRDASRENENKVVAYNNIELYKRYQRNGRHKNDIFTAKGDYFPPFLR